MEIKPQFKIETKRLIIKSADNSLARKVLDYNIKNKDFFSSWVPTRTSDFFTLERQETVLTKKAVDFKDEKEFGFFMFKKSDVSSIIGDFGFSNVIKGAFLSCHLGYQMDQSEINRGYMEEALRYGIRFLFSDRKLHRIEANVMPRNKPSIRLLEKLGFENEGLSKKYLKINGKWEDHFHFVLLNENID